MHSTFTNVKAADLDDEDTTYCNVKRQTLNAAGGELHFRKGADPSREVSTTLYSHHYRSDKLPYRIKQFRLKRSIAREVDFVYLLPVPPWFSFGFSQPQDAHHLVSHVSLGNTIFYPSSRPYVDAETGVELMGYRRAGRPRAHSFDC